MGLNNDNNIYRQKLYIVLITFMGSGGSKKDIYFENSTYNVLQSQYLSWTQWGSESKNDYLNFLWRYSTVHRDVDVTCSMLFL